MKIFHSILIVTFGVAVGLAVGWFASGRQWRHFEKQFEISVADRAFADISDAYGVLRSLRHGDTNEAIDTLEGSLDGNIMVLGVLVKDLRIAQRKPEHIRILTRLRDYRIAHPRKTDSPEIDKGVADAFALVSTQNQP